MNGHDLHGYWVLVVGWRLLRIGRIVRTTKIGSVGDDGDNEYLTKENYRYMVKMLFSGREVACTDRSALLSLWTSRQLRKALRAYCLDIFC